jgi:acyl-CoA synthetase (AMP-forming)/AMP-acid ligase II
MQDFATIAEAPLPPQSIWRQTPALSVMPGWSDAFPITPVMAHLEDAAGRFPRAPALIGSRERLDIDAVVQRAHRIGAWVQNLVPAGLPVATLLSHTPSGIAVLLGCVASGRLTIALNPGDPPDRLAMLLEDSAAAAVVTDQAPPPRVPGRARVLEVRDCTSASGARPATPIHDPDAPCMVHYTSGSSGRPKGVVLSAYNILFRAFQNIHGRQLGPESRVLTALGPDNGAGMATIVGCLLSGATALIANLRADGARAVLRLCESERVDILMAPPPVMNIFAALDSARAAFAHLRIARTGAGAAARKDAARWRGLLPAGCEMWHGYASTEAMVLAEHPLPTDLAGDEATVPVGRICAGLDYAILGEDGRPVPDGEAGELVVRGRQIAVGEWQAGRFFAGRMPPDTARPGTRVFRTGDLVRFGADGMLRFAGRVDRQIKINGVRVEPAEIEAVIRADPAVRDVAVVASGAGVLHAFVAAATDDPERLRAALVARLRAALPSPLRPRGICILANLPMLPGGKVDIVTLRQWAERPETPAG